MTTPILTPAIIMDLRASCPSLRTLGGGVNFGIPYIVYLPADEAFALIHDGSPQCKHPDARVLGALLAAEREERGFIKRILSASEDCESVILPDRAAKRAAFNAKLTAERSARDAEAFARRRLQARVPAAISLDDLLGD